MDDLWNVASNILAPFDAVVDAPRAGLWALLSGNDPWEAITDRSKRIRGTDIVGEDSPVLGLAAEIAGDPTNWLMGAGLVSKLLKGRSLAGELDAAVKAEQALQPSPVRQALDAIYGEGAFPARGRRKVASFDDIDPSRIRKGHIDEVIDREGELDRSLRDSVFATAAKNLVSNPEIAKQTGKDLHRLVAANLRDMTPNESSLRTMGDTVFHIPEPKAYTPGKTFADIVASEKIRPDRQQLETIAERFDMEYVDLGDAINRFTSGRGTAKDNAVVRAIYSLSSVPNDEVTSLLTSRKYPVIANPEQMIELQQLRDYIDGSPQLRYLKPDVLFDDSTKRFWLDFGRDSQMHPDVMNDFLPLTKDKEGYDTLLEFLKAPSPTAAKAFPAVFPQVASRLDYTPKLLGDLAKSMGVHGYGFLPSRITSPMGFTHAARPDMIFAQGAGPEATARAFKSIGMGGLYDASNYDLELLRAIGHEGIHTGLKGIGGYNRLDALTRAIGQRARNFGATMRFWNEGGTSGFPAAIKELGYAKANEEGIAEYIGRALAGGGLVKNEATGEMALPLGLKAIDFAANKPEVSRDMIDLMLRVSLGDMEKATRIPLGHLEESARLVGNILTGQYTKGQPLGPFSGYVSPDKFGWRRGIGRAPIKLAFSSDSMPGIYASAGANEADDVINKAVLRRLHAEDALENKPSVLPLLAAMGLYDFGRSTSDVVRRRAEEADRLALMEALGA